MNAEGCEVDLNEIERKLAVSKRRIYDVTNVLSGIGAIIRCGKSKIKLVFQDISPLGSGFNFNHFSTEKEKEKEKEIDRLMCEVNHELLDLYESSDFRSHAWLSPDDILRVNGEDVSVFGLRGTPDTTIEATNDDNHFFKIICASENGFIDFERISK